MTTTIAAMTKDMPPTVPPAIAAVFEGFVCVRPRDPAPAEFVADGPPIERAVLVKTPLDDLVSYLEYGCSRTTRNVDILTSMVLKS